MEDNLHIEDGSNDKAYFTMVPNIVLNHSTAIDQALYMQMKRFAGEKSGGGYCTASKRTLMEKLGVGPKALNTSIDYLVKHKWIGLAGTRKVMTNGGSQDIQIYRVNDIWKLNTEHYKGAAESAPLHEGANERSQGANESASTKNTRTISPTAKAEEPIEIVVDAPDLKNTPEMLAFYTIFSHNPARFTFKGRVHERDATKVLLREYGYEECKRRYKITQKYKSDSICPQIDSPADMLSKMVKMEHFLKSI